MQGNWVLSLCEREISWLFLSCSGNLGYVLELRWGYPLKTFVCSATSVLLSSYDGHLRNLNYAWQYNTDSCGGEAGDRGSLSSWNSDIGIPIHFKKSQASSPFEPFNSLCLSRCQRDVIPPVQMRRRPTAFSRVSTGDSDIPSASEMRDEPEFMLLQGNPAFFCVRASLGPFHLRQKTQDPPHVPIAEGKLHLRCLWKVGPTLQSKIGNQLSS